jgi:hypothetical protein
MFSHVFGANAKVRSRKESAISFTRPTTTYRIYQRPRSQEPRRKPVIHVPCRPRYLRNRRQSHSPASHMNRSLEYGGAACFSNQGHPRNLPLRNSCMGSVQSTVHHGHAGKIPYADSNSPYLGHLLLSIQGLAMSLLQVCEARKAEHYGKNLSMEPAARPISATDLL